MGNDVNKFIRIWASIVSLLMAIGLFTGAAVGVSDNIQHHDIVSVVIWFIVGLVISPGFLSLAIAIAFKIG